MRACTIGQPVILTCMSLQHPVQEAEILENNAHEESIDKKNAIMYYLQNN